MFKSKLSDAVKQIFDLDKVTFDLPSESKEQECAFIEIESSVTSFGDTKEVAKVTGKILVFARSEKLPYGYFAKCIKNAPKELTLPFYFYDFEENLGTFRDIVQRSLGFVYFFDSQYDPSVGTIESITLQTVVE